MLKRNNFLTCFLSHFPSTSSVAATVFALTIFSFGTAIVRADTVFTAVLNGSQAIPAINSSASGVGSVILDSSETQVTVTLNLNNFRNAQTSAAVYGPAPRGVPGDLVFNFPGGASTRTFNISTDQAADLKAGLWYFNVSTQSFPTGEIRGQIEPLCVPPPANMAAWYRAENNLIDTTGNNGGSAPNGVGYVRGKVGQAFGFNGTDQYANLGGGFSSQNFTISMWVKPATAQMADATLVDNNATATANWAIQQNQSQANNYYYRDNAGSVNFDLTANEWQHLVVTRANNGIRIYRNGVPQNFGNVFAPINYDGAQTLLLARYFNRDNQGSNRYWNGQIDELAVFERPLTDNEIRSLYYSGASGVCTDSASISARKNGKIIYQRVVGNGKPQIMTINEDGTNPNDFLNDPNYSNFHPAYSPDNSRIAFSRDWKVNTMSAYGGAATPLFNSTVSMESFPRWSPDGSKIALSIGGSEEAEIYVANSNGSNLTRLTNNSVYDYGAEWSPDGSKLVFTSAREGGFKIFTMKPDGSQVTKLTDGGTDRNPVYSPDGKRIMFSRSNDIYVMKADGSNVVNLTSSTYIELESVWSPDGKKIVFARFNQSTGSRELWTMNVDGSGQILLIANDSNAMPMWQSLPNNQNVAVSPANGVRLVFSSVNSVGSTVATRLMSNSLPKLPNGYFAASPMYDIRTSVGYNNFITISLTVDSISSSSDCAQLQLLHFNNGFWSDINNSSPFFKDGTCTVSQSVSSLSPFVVARYVPYAQMATLAGTVTYGTTPAGQAAKPVSDVSLTAAGMTYASATNNSNGSYLLGNLLSGGHYVVTPSKTGSVNGITGFDATLVLRCVAAGINCTLTANQKLAADANNSGALSAFDATQILRFVAAGMQTNATGAVGNWKFTPAARDYASLGDSNNGENYGAILVGEVNGSWTPPANASFARSDEEFLSVQEKIESSAVNPVQASLAANFRGAANSIVVIPIIVNNTGESISAYTVEVSFDPNVIQPDTAQPTDTAGTLTGSGFSVVADTTTATGRIGIAASSGAATISGSGTLINLRFKVTGKANSVSGKTALSLTRTLFESNEGNPIAATIENGIFRIKTAPAIFVSN